MLTNGHKSGPISAKSRNKISRLRVFQNLTKCSQYWIINYQKVDLITTLCYVINYITEPLVLCDLLHICSMDTKGIYTKKNVTK
jgi:hypothetical protein